MFKNIEHAPVGVGGEGDVYGGFKLALGGGWGAGFAVPGYVRVGVMEEGDDAHLGVPYALRGDDAEEEHYKRGKVRSGEQAGERENAAKQRELERKPECDEPLLRRIVFSRRANVAAHLRGRENMIPPPQRRIEQTRAKRGARGSIAGAAPGWKRGVLFRRERRVAGVTL